MNFIEQIIVTFILNVLFCLSCFICFEHDMYNVICMLFILFYHVQRDLHVVYTVLSCTM